MDANTLFTEEWTKTAFPPELTGQFFDALFGDAEEGAYDIALRYVGSRGNMHEFSFDLHQRPGMCLACNLTYGLPQVFSRHPIINVKGVVDKIAEALGKEPSSVAWELKPTRETSTALHCIPLVVSV